MSLNDLHPLWKYKIYREITKEQRPQKPECGYRKEKEK